MPRIKVNTTKNVNNTPKELPKQRIVKKTPLIGSQRYLPNSIPATKGTGIIVR